MLSQELRTNLQAMLGFAQLMQRDQKEPLLERQRDRARRVLDEGEHMLRVLDDACTLVRIDSGQLPLARQAVDVAGALERVRIQLEPAAVSRKLRIVDCSPLPDRPQVMADPRAFVEILLELMKNAIVYNQPGGSITFQVSPMDASRLRISVIDTGIGVPPEEQHKLFRPFPHLARPTGAAGGVGLGLAKCQRLVERMAGSIGLRSVSSGGSEFWVDLPAYRT